MPRDAATVRRIALALLRKASSAERVSRHAKLLFRDPRIFVARLREFMQNAEWAGSYDTWVERYDTLAPADMALLASAASALRDGPLISLIMPVYNPPERFLRRAVQSVRAQAYQKWELCIADDCSTESGVAALLREFASEDARIKVCCRPENGGIAAASNSALELAGGAFVGFIDQDDEIPAHALMLVARQIAADPEIDLIYTDEDKIDQEGRRFDPNFKPDWNPALLLSQNFVNHLVVYRSSLVRRAGGFRGAYSGSQDYDLLLRCAEHTTPDRIRHIPHVLYHWRAVAGSTAKSAAAKPYAIEAGRRAVQDALDRRGLPATVRITSHKYYQVDYHVPAVLPAVSILIPSACRSHLVEDCLHALLKTTTYPNFEVLLLVNETAKEQAENRARLQDLSRDARVKVLFYRDHPFNFSWINNWGAAQAQGSVLCFMNDDTQVISPDWLEQLVVRLMLDGVGAVGAMLYYPNDTIQHGGGILGSGGVADHAHRAAPRSSAGYFGRAALEQDWSCVTAACAVISREVFESIGGFDEQLAVAFNDIDLCIRLTRAGWRILWTPTAELYHHESATLGPYHSAERYDQFRREEQLMRDRWASVLTTDRFYNPNLSLLNGQSFKLAFPPRVDWRAEIAQTRMQADKACN